MFPHTLDDRFPVRSDRLLQHLYRAEFLRIFECDVVERTADNDDRKFWNGIAKLPNQSEPIRTQVQVHERDGKSEMLRKIECSLGIGHDKHLSISVQYGLRLFEEGFVVIDHENHTRFPC
jgi:hypothetical protein